MATIERKEGKRGVSYLITVHCGYDLHYRKIRHYKTWRVPEGWSEKRAEREAQKIAVEFEQKIQQGFLVDNKQTFAEYATYVIDLKERTGVKHSTIQSYRYLMEKWVCWVFCRFWQKNLVSVSHRPVCWSVCLLWQWLQPVR